MVSLTHALVELLSSGASDINADGEWRHFLRILRMLKLFRLAKLLKLEQLAWKSMNVFYTSPRSVLKQHH